ncbi:phosphoribosylpyrophosphate synthetase [Fulvivirga lutea]|uniref:Phosphoribosylpyrophosphate synthetase n=1 Tax=Fulvivirga lutea TaxID=2810512 RepID=A0A975A2H7_9BACT|nr:phosphoribosylpyrophosphate synthetase [Fulvivirga lutea]QSE98861.1 phosphoribosylpyrophosphate synthetase [Fulvivirga lutea]
MSKHHLKTLVETLNDLRAEGFKEDFEYRNHTLKVIGQSKPYKPEEVEVVGQYRFEGESNPSDASILYSLKTKDGKKGTVIDSYGASADADLQNFLDKATK